jgi:VWFA-related protein
MKTFVSLMFISLFAYAGHSQQPAAGPPVADEVVKITSKLVQLDVVVTDGSGRQVTDLTANDFEILEDGKPQKITHLSYVSTGSGNKRSGDGATPGGPAGLRAGTPIRVGGRSGTGRLITFVVDDGNCLASQSGMMASREALEKFVNEQMLPDDRVAIYQTRSGSSLFQQYTSDKALLLRAAKKIRWYPPIGPCATADGSYYAAAKPNTFDKAAPGGATVQIESDAERKTRESTEDFSRKNQVVGTIGVLRYVIRGLEQAGGRKIVFFMSDGMPMLTREGRRNQADEVLRDVTDLANRSSVVFNTIDVRGLFDPSMIEARDSVSTRDDATASESIATTRVRDVEQSRDGLALLAYETGGDFYHNQNFLDVPIRKALDLEKGYYLVAYEPEDDTFKGKNFNKIDIRVRRAGLRVMSRSGFAGNVTPAPVPVKRRSADSELYDAIVAPLPRAGLALRLTAFFGNSEKGNYVRSYTHIDGNAITFVDDAKGMKRAVFDVVAVTLNEKNQVVDEFSRTHTISVEPAAVPVIRTFGLDYSTDVSIKKPGTYNFRMAIRDANSKTIGSAGQVVQIPDLEKAGVVVSGLAVTATQPDGKFSIPTETDPVNAISMPGGTAVPAVRIFRRGTVLAYAFNVYNVKIDSTIGKPKLSVQTNLYQNGKLISEGKPQITQLEPHTDWSRIRDYAYLRIEPKADIGDYAIEVIVRDLSAGRNSVSSQWIDFEIVE